MQKEILLFIYFYLDGSFDFFKRKKNHITESLETISIRNLVALTRSIFKLMLRVNWLASNSNVEAGDGP